MYFSNNVKFLRKRKGCTQKEVANHLGMFRSTLSGYENKISQPTIAALLAFSKYYGISVDSLLQIDLSKIPEYQLSELERGGDIYIKGSNMRVLATTIDKDNKENIEMVSEKAKAGYATGFADPEYLQELPRFQIPFLSNQKKYRTFQISGDSMLPIPHGAWITGEFVQDWNNIINGHGYIILTLNDGIVFKIVENLIEKDKILRLYSLNPIYEPFDISVSEVVEVWKFIHYISSEIPEPMIPHDELIKTVASLKKDMNVMKKRFLPKGKV